MPLRQSEILKYKMHVLWHFDEEESATSTKAYRKKAYEGYNQRVQTFFGPLISVSHIYISLF